MRGRLEVVTLAQRKRTVLLWGCANMGKTTFAASLMQRPDMRRCAYFDFDNSAEAVPQYFGPGGPGEPIEVSAGAEGWSKVMREFLRVRRGCRSGDFNSLIFDGLSAFYMDDVGLVAAEHPDEVDKGDSEAKKLRAISADRLNAICSMINACQREAKSPSFTVVLTAHAKQSGAMGSQFDMPDMSVNAWRRISRLAQTWIEFKRKSGAPTLLYQDPDNLYRRIKSPGALAYLKANPKAIQELKTLPDLLGLFEAAEAHAQAKAAGSTSSSNPDNNENEQAPTGAQE